MHASLAPSRRSPDEALFSVSDILTFTKDILENKFPSIWISGEISNFSCPSSGHWYFTLKDEKSQLRSAMFRMHQSPLGFKPQNGMQVQARGKLSLYTARGDFQFIADWMEPSGEGALRKAFELLKHKLAAEGLFSDTHKKILPTHPTRIGIITSSTGAALRDILQITGKRGRHIPIIIYPCLVQGDSAAGSIVAALQTAQRRQECDLLILARGGGSLEDLWPFNEEIVAREIHQCAIPIISGVGHEVDFTIADFVADQRAPTPSAAAMLATQATTTVVNQIQQLHQRLTQRITSQQDRLLHFFKMLQKRLQHPATRLHQRSQQCDYLEQRLHQAIRQQLARYTRKIEQLIHRHAERSPKHLLQAREFQLKTLQQRQVQTILLRLHQQKSRFAELIRLLHATSPLNVLSRGYAIVQKENAEILRSVKEADFSKPLTILLADGEIDAQITKISIKK